MAVLLGVQEIPRTFGPRPLFAGLSLDLRAGERVGLIGPNGAGKCTLLRMLAGRDPAIVGPDARYDAGELFLALEGRGTEPHWALTRPPKPEAAARPEEWEQVAARHRALGRQPGAGYRLSQKCRKKLEQGFGRLYQAAGLARSRVVGRWKVRRLWELGAVAYSLVRTRRLPGGG